MHLVFATDELGEFPRLFIDVRLIQQHQQWHRLCDLMGALKLSLQCDCAVELGPLQQVCENLFDLFPHRPILQITVRPETWQAKPTSWPSLTAVQP